MNGTKKNAARAIMTGKSCNIIPPSEPGFLTERYIENGLFAKVVDMPADDAAYKGFTLEGLSRGDSRYYLRELERLNWYEATATALKWQRLFAGSLIVVFANDGRGLEEPLDRDHVRSVDGLQVIDSTNIETTLDREGQPERFRIMSKRVCCTVHPSRCILFRSDRLPEISRDPVAEFWGAALYYRTEKAIQDVIISHGIAPKILQKSGGTVYKVHGLSEMLSHEGGHERAAERLRMFEELRALFSTAFIDPEEDLQIAPLPETLVQMTAVINGTWEALTAATGIPPEILIGEHIDLTAGEVRGTWKKSEAQQALEQYASFVRTIQETQIKKPLLSLLSLIGRSGLASGDLEKLEQPGIKWRPVFNLSGVERAHNDLKREQVKLKKAQTLQAEIDAGIISPEIRAKFVRNSYETKGGGNHDTEERRK